ncbi:MAG: alpha/beta hydrolase [Verrucomicrobiales bacterium]|nr:alpha/beta hydrolase [Verrucomicrobiales bacterium]
MKHELTHNRLIFAALLLLLLTGCATPQPGMTRLAATPIGYVSQLQSARLNEVNHKDNIPVFIVSGRNVVPNPRGVNPFGDERNDAPVPNLGIAKVSVGEGMTSGEIIADTLKTNGRRGKTRFRLKNVELIPTPPVDHFSIEHEDAHFQDNPWVKELNKVLRNSRSKKISIYVHGYNTEFITSAELCAEVVHFHAREGAVINFAWPSQGNIGAYLADKGNAEYSTRHFRGLLELLARETCAEKIDIVAHSAGNPIVVNAMKEIRILQRHMTADQLRDKYKVNSVVLAAPDMDLQTFINAVFDRFHELAQGVAVYTSQTDKALDIARKLFRAERLGRAAADMDGWEKDTLTQVNRIEMIDVTNAEGQSRELLGHNYFYRNPWVSTDIGLFVENFSPEERNLVPGENGLFWTFPDNYDQLVRARR